jgi:methionine salvage enolase-phosphatase E1
VSATPQLLLDIEGTTTPVTFVTDVLFPFAPAFGRSWNGTPASPA